MYLACFRYTAAVVFAAVATISAQEAQVGAGATGSAPGTGGGNQGGSSSIPGNSGGNQGGTGRPSRFPSTEDQRRDPFGSADRQQQMIFLSGKVTMEDGTPPPDFVVIERVCNGNVRPEGYTDSKGKFSFNLGQNSAMLADASVGSPGGSNDPDFSGVSRNSGFGRQGGGNNRLFGCEIRASLPGFKSQPVDLSQRRYLDNPDVGTIVIRPLARTQGFTFSATTAYAPKDARKAWDKGRELIKKNKVEAAEKELLKAVGEYPKFAAAWYELGTVYHQTSRTEEAVNAYKESIKNDPKFVSPYAQLTRIAANQGKWEEAAEWSGKALKLNPYMSSDLYFLSGVAHYQTRKFEDAESYAREALKLDAQHKNPKISHLLGAILAEKRDLPGAAEQMRFYLQFAPQAKDADSVKQQLAEIERVMGQGSTASAP